MSRKPQIMPIILGMNPPTKLCTLMKTERPLKGIALFISYAKYKEGVRKGTVIKSADVAEVNGLLAWIHFKDTEDLRRFGQMCLDFADGKRAGDVH